MRTTLKLCASCAILLFAASAALAEDPVAYVSEVRGGFVCTSRDGIAAPLAVGLPLYNGCVIRMKDKGYYKYIDRSGNFSQSISYASFVIKGMPGIEKAKQAAFLAYIGGSMARSGKGASSNEFLDWMMTDIGAVMERDVASGDMAISIGPGASSSETKRYRPLAMKINPRYRAKSVSYKVVQSTLVVAEGRFERKGENWVLPLKEIAAQADQVVPLSLSLVLVDANDGAEKTFALELSYSVMADDGFIEGEIRNAAAELSRGVEKPNAAVLERMARLYVYGEYRLNLNALELQAGD